MNVIAEKINDAFISSCEYSFDLLKYHLFFSPEIFNSKFYVQISAGEIIENPNELWDFV